MFTFTNEFFNGALISFVLGLLVNWLIYNSQLNHIGALLNLRQLYGKRTDPKFSFNKMAFEIHKLLGEGKAVAASTIRNFYLRRTTTRSIMAIQSWIDEEKKKDINYLDGGTENDVDDSSNNNSKKNNEI